MNLKTLTLLLSTGLLSASLASPALADRCSPGKSKHSDACAAPIQHKAQDKKPGQQQHQKQVQKQKQEQKQTHKQTHKQTVKIRKGERLATNHTILKNPGRYGLRKDRTYVIVEKEVYQIDPDTRAVLNIIGALAQLSN